MKRKFLLFVAMFIFAMCVSSCYLSPEHTHEFGEWTITENATCAKAGLTVRYCDCGEEQSASIPKLSHNIVVDEAVEATCTKTGLTEGEHCSLCREILVEQKEVDALGHTVVVDKALAPTCTETGITEGKHCSTCNDILVAQAEIPKINHTYDNENDKDCNECGFVRNVECDHSNFTVLPSEDATCIIPGLSEGKVCADCEFIIVEQTVIDAKGHTEVVDEAVEPTYETTGLTEGKHCSVCGAVTVEQQIVPMKAIYNITYIGAYTHTNPTTYTSEDSIKLTAPKCEGLSFSHWTNADGVKIESIEKGTTGNITLTANWKYLENYVVSGENSSYSTVYDPEDNLYFFIFEIGEIRNVILEVLDSFNYDGTQELPRNYTRSVSITESTANTVAKSVSTVVTQSASWSDTVQKSNHISGSLNISEKFSAGVKIDDMLNLSRELGMNIGIEVGSEYSHTTVNGTSNGTSTETQQSTSSTVSYIANASTQVETQMVLTPELNPSGLYRYANVGVVNVYAIVTYDCLTQKYYIDIYNQITEETSTRLIYNTTPENSSDIVVVESDEIDINIDIDGLADYVAVNAYCVKFDANDGRGVIDTQVILPNTNASLEFVELAREYYEFDGWCYDTEGTLYANINDVNDDAENITLYAKWSQTYPDYIYISSAEDFKWHIGNNLQKSSKPDNCGAGKYMLLNDIDLGDWNEGWGFTYWAANNDSTTLNGKTCFIGVFDGQNHTITYKLRVGKTNLQSWAFGLFPVTDGATIRNLKVNADLSTYDPQNRGQVWHISNADMAQDAMVGGIVGYAQNTTIENCSVSGRVIYNSEGGAEHGDTCVAGVVGYAYNSNINNCSSSAEVYARGFNVEVAGIIGCYYNTSYSGLNSTGKINCDNPWLFGTTNKKNEVARLLKLF